MTCKNVFIEQTENCHLTSTNAIVSYELFISWSDEKKYPHIFASQIDMIFRSLHSDNAKCLWEGGLVQTSNKWTTKRILSETWSLSIQKIVRTMNGETKICFPREILLYSIIQQFSVHDDKIIHSIKYQASQWDQFASRPVKDFISWNERIIFAPLTARTQSRGWCQIHSNRIIGADTEKKSLNQFERVADSWMVDWFEQRSVLYSSLHSLYRRLWIIYDLSKTNPSW